jgi:hypothetical protein
MGRGRFYFTDDMFTLPEIFTQESMIVQRNYINEEPFQPILAQTEPLLSGINSVPDLLGYVATSAKQTAEIALLSKREDPVLAFWQSGLGQTIAFTSDPTPGWGKLWLQWPEFERFWAQAARFLARKESPARFRTSFSAAGNSTTVIVEAMDEQGAFITDAEFAGVLVDSAEKSHSLRFLQTAPGRYEATVEAKGSLFGKIFENRNGNLTESAIVQFPGAPGREHETGGQGKDRLAQLTGNLVKSPEQLRFSNRISRDFQPLQKQLLMLAAFLFLLDVALRRIDFRTLRFPRKKPVEATATASPVLGTLKERKRGMGRKENAELEQIFASTDRAPSERSSEPVAATVEKEIAPETAPPEVQSSDYMQRLKEAKRRKS